jgi:sec-independent protein translocase protein TatA
MFLGVPGWMEILVIGFITLLIFGKRLPDTMRSLGKGVVEFKKGLKGIPEEEEVTKVVSSEVDNKTTQS